jgi:hypothetical protein
MFTFNGTALILDGKPDVDGDSFSPDCSLHFPKEVPVFNATGNRIIGQVTSYHQTLDLGEPRVLHVSGTLNPEEEEFYIRACEENQGLYLGLRGMVTRETRTIRGMIIREVNVIGIQLGFHNQDSRISRVSIQVTRDDEAFRRAYEEAYSVSPRVQDEAPEFRTNLVHDAAIVEAEAPRVAVVGLQEANSALLGRNLPLFLEALRGDSPCVLRDDVPLPCDEGIQCDEDCEHCDTPCYPESDDVPMIHGQEVTGARPRTNLR